MTAPDPATLREALIDYTPNPSVIPATHVDRLALDRYWDQRARILAAARWALDLIEGGTEVEWCEVHGAALRPGTVECWIGYGITMGNADDLCRLVKRLLVAL